MIKKLLSFVQITVLILIVTLLLALFVFFQKDIAPALAEKYLKEFNIEYKELRGTLFSGVEIYGFIYEDSLHVDKLSIKYNFLSLLNPTPRVDYIAASGVKIDLDKLLLSLKNSDESSHIAFNISKIEVNNGVLNYQKEKVLFDLSADELSFRDALDIEKISLHVKTKYADAEFLGYFKDETLRGALSFTLVDFIEKKYISTLAYKPKKIEADIWINSQEINLVTTLKEATPKYLPDFLIKDIKLKLRYLFESKDLTLKADYSATYKEFEVAIIQDAKMDKNLHVSSQIAAEIITKDIDIAFDRFVIDLEHNPDESYAKFSAKDIEADFKTLDFIKYTINADTAYAKFDANLSLENNETLLESNIYPKKEFLHYKEYDLKRFSKVTLMAREKNSNISMFVKSDIASISMLANEEGADGYVYIGSAIFDYRVDLKNKIAVVESKINSIDKFLKELQIPPFKAFFDAKVEAKSIINFKDSLEVTSSVKIPFYTLILDSKRDYSGKDNSFNFVYKDKELILNRYDVSVENQRVTSSKPSKISFNDDFDIEFKEFWIYENILLRGVLKSSDMSGDFSLFSESYHYKSKEADVMLKLDLHAIIDAQGRENISGDIEIKSGSIMYKLKKDYAISDKDIIIIQDMKESKNEDARAINIAITSSKPIKYEVEDISLLIEPSLILYKDMDSNLEIFGALSIKSGVVNLEDRVFEFDESEIYFYGGDEIDPYLNLNLHYYTTDYIDIEIYVTNRVSSPVVLFSSKPAMSQNDILSYILFDSSASSLFDTTSESKTSLNTLLLGSGIKKIVNSSGVLRVDTLNILTNKEGTLGYEVGARFNKNIRIVYKNDEISSLILQYSLSKSLRVDVDVKETGQGVSIIYIKDFDIHTP
ncbi:translocation/assembly module TamB domain-containing protein [Sulfurimonas denitrificans]|uniref:translocation/assembly module TamB domain-containing protein n=1 Tax=Sulfurimonas denitrificans TaxID=39766 RepID=UPI000056F3CD|nr:translocation/assembly module TamB domain-containing protein [Sulfurimonas denitrificans]